MQLCFFFGLGPSSCSVLVMRDITTYSDIYYIYAAILYSILHWFLSGNFSFMSRHVSFEKFFDKTSSLAGIITHFGKIYVFVRLRHFRYFLGVFFCIIFSYKGIAKIRLTTDYILLLIKKCFIRYEFQFANIEPMFLSCNVNVWSNSAFHFLQFHKTK